MSSEPFSFSFAFSFSFFKGSVPVNPNPLLPRSIDFFLSDSTDEEGAAAPADGEGAFF